VREKHANHPIILGKNGGPNQKLGAFIFLGVQEEVGIDGVFPLAVRQAVIVSK
jgi:hypothetical protein